MKNFIKICLFFSIFMSNSCVFPETISGQVNQDEMLKMNQVVDLITGRGVGNAKITIPSKKYATQTDSEGRFQIKTNIDEEAILSVEKEGYKPFTITLNRDSLYEPIRIEIEKMGLGDIVLDNKLHHLGDNVFSANSANCADFKALSTGPYFTKEFALNEVDPSNRAYLVIGSVIGLDTKSAKDLRQNSIHQVYSSPALIFFNGHKIGELTINGDSQRIPIPTSLVKRNNELTIQTGRNLFQTSHVDYDDIEIMGLSIEIQKRDVFSYIK